MVLKLDLVKVDDSLEWDFIHQTPLHFKFPQNFIDVIIACVTTNLVYIVLNGGDPGSFHPL